MLSSLEVPVRSRHLFREPANLIMYCKIRSILENYEKIYTDNEVSDKQRQNSKTPVTRETEPLLIAYFVRAPEEYPI